MMYGIEYQRLRCRFSVREFAKRAGVSFVYVNRACQNPWVISGHIAIKLADALGVSIDELVRVYEGEEVDNFSHRAAVRSRTANPGNCLERYRIANRLTFAELARRLGNTSREAGRKACLQEKPLRKHIHAIAKYEGISEEAFREKYQ